MEINEVIEDLRYDAQCNRAALDIEWAEKNEQLAEWLEELKVYKDAEEQGLLLRLPLPEGTQVHCIGSCGEICDDYSTDCEVCGEHKVVFTTSFDRNIIEQFGQTVFATEEEAEQALAGMKGE